MLDCRGMIATEILQGGKAAAETILDMRASGDFSKLSCRNYEKRWVKDFGYDFNNVRRRHTPKNPFSPPHPLAQLFSAKGLQRAHS